jgi:hypothetical protein
MLSKVVRAAGVPGSSDEFSEAVLDPDFYKTFGGIRPSARTDKEDHTDVNLHAQPYAEVGE